jgi:hypothetical protein
MSAPSWRSHARAEKAQKALSATTMSPAWKKENAAMKSRKSCVFQLPGKTDRNAPVAAARTARADITGKPHPRACPEGVS